jgi:ubiquinone/menaquinone biosynthesis C-methylase UbiE
MIPEDALVNASQLCLDAGVRILQGFRLAETDRTHVAELLELMAPVRGTLWADIGCGFGEVASLMSQARPDLGFVLVNNNQFQLNHAPNRFLQLRADMHDIPLPDACVDGCMFLYSLCHADGLGTALWEAARITRAGGALFVFDYERLSGDNDLMMNRLFARAYAFERVRTIATNADWEITLHVNPRGDDALFRRLYGNEAEYELIFQDLLPVVWKAVRR